MSQSVCPLLRCAHVFVFQTCLSHTCVVNIACDNLFVTGCCSRDSVPCAHNGTHMEVYGQHQFYMRPSMSFFCYAFLISILTEHVHSRKLFFHCYTVLVTMMVLSSLVLSLLTLIMGHPNPPMPKLVAFSYRTNILFTFMSHLSYLLGLHQSYDSQVCVCVH